MPLYEYQCRKCGHSFEMLRRIKDVDSDLECPACHSAEVERQLSTFAAGSCSPSSRGFT
jgi:putative FmdB family regulatory protein